MPLTAAGSALVAGGTAKTMATAPNRKIRVNRAFYFEGKLRAVGEELVVPTTLAFELFTARKAEGTEQEPSEEHIRAKAEAKAKTSPKQAALA